MKKRITRDEHRRIREAVDQCRALRRVEDAITFNVGDILNLDTDEVIEFSNLVIAGDRHAERELRDYLTDNGIRVART